MRRISGILLVLALLVLAGCGQKINLDRKIKLEPSDVQAIIVDAPKGEQNIVVTTSTPGAPISVFVVEEADLESAKQALLSGKAPAKHLAKQEKTESGNLSAKIPAKTGYAIVLHSPPGTKSTEASVKVTGK